MKNISISQILIIILLGILLFSDFSKITKKLNKFVKNCKFLQTLKKNKFRKKGI